MKIVDDETLFLADYCSDKKELYRQRYNDYSLLQWWLLFIWTVSFGVYLGLFRLLIYGWSVLFRLFFLPFRLFTELFITSKILRRLLFFFFGFFETVFGILWLRDRFFFY